MNSLYRLIDRVWQYPTVLTRERFIARQGDFGDIDLADGWFTDLAGDGDYIDPRIPAQDAADLKAKTAQVRNWVNTSVAHVSDTKKPVATPPIPAIHEAIDDVAALFVKYMNLIQGVTVDREVIMSGWETIFRVPWISDDDQWRDVSQKIQDDLRKRRDGR